MRDKIQDYAAVEAAAMKFVNKCCRREQHLCKRAFHRGCSTVWNPRRSNGAWVNRAFLQQCRHSRAGGNFKARIDVLAVEETVAVVRVLEEGWGGRIDFTDFLLLLKLDGEWRCVAKSLQPEFQHDKTYVVRAHRSVRSY